MLTCNQTDVMDWEESTLVYVNLHHVGLQPLTI